MSHGVAGVLTLYDENGHPVRVCLEDGVYKLVASDERTHQSLDEIKLLLLKLVELLEGMQS